MITRVYLEEYFLSRSIVEYVDCIEHICTVFMPWVLTLEPYAAVYAGSTVYSLRIEFTHPAEAIFFRLKFGVP